MRWRAVRVLVASAVIILPVGSPPATAQPADDLFNDQTIQRLDLYVNSRDWARLTQNFQLNTHYAADLWWRGQAARNVGIRSHGGWSRSSIKPALLIEFGRYVGGQRFGGSDAVVLKNLTQDASGVRDFLAMKLLRRFGVPVPREAFAALFVNNTFMGLYGIVEVIGPGALRRMFGDDTGYLFEFDWTDFPAEVPPYYFPYVGPDPSAYAAFFKPVTHKLETAAQLYGPIEAWCRTVESAADEGFVAAVSTYLDIDAFLRFVAGQAYLAEVDGLLGAWGMNNFLLYRPVGSTVHRFVAWDEDHALESADFALTSGHAENPIMRRLMQSADVRRAYFAAVLEAAALADQVDDLAADPAGGPAGPRWFEREAARVIEMIRPAALADTRRGFTNDEFETDAARVLDVIRARGAFVRREVARLTAEGAGGAAAGVATGTGIR